MVRLLLAAQLTAFISMSFLTHAALAEEFQLHSFSRQQLSDVYYSEGIAAGDVDMDGQADIIYGPHWYAGPEFSKKQEIYPAVPQRRVT